MQARAVAVRQLHELHGEATAQQEAESATAVEGRQKLAAEARLHLHRKGIVVRREEHHGPAARCGGAAILVALADQPRDRRHKERIVPNLDALGVTLL